MNKTVVEAPNPGSKAKLDINSKRVLLIWLVDWNVVPGSAKMLLQEHVVLGEITNINISYCKFHRDLSPKYSILMYKMASNIWKSKNSINENLLLFTHYLFQTNFCMSYIFCWMFRMFFVHNGHKQHPKSIWVFRRYYITLPSEQHE